MLYAWLMKVFSAAGEACTRAAALGVYYGVLTPAAVLYRLFHGDFLGLRRRPGGTCFRPRAHKFVPADLEKPW
ncbi:MAG: hypothetical protein NDI60_04130 [Elusimicrobiales bacterium]|nr:hypothetical protein [Elusimicrobiales bacterium]